MMEIPACWATIGEVMSDLRPPRRMSPPIGRLNARQYLEQGALARSILSHQGKDFAGLQAEGHLLEGMHAGKGLVEITYFQDRYVGARWLVVDLHGRIL